MARFGSGRQGGPLPWRSAAGRGIGSAMPARKATVPDGRAATASRPRRSLWRLFFAVDYRPPRNIFEVRRRRYRASFFFLLGVVATLAVQAAFERIDLWPF